jgi:hypothetical protein
MQKHQVLNIEVISVKLQMFCHSSGSSKSTNREKHHRGETILIHQYMTASSADWSKLVEWIQYSTLTVPKIRMV